MGKLGAHLHKASLAVHERMFYTHMSLRRLLRTPGWLQEAWSLRSLRPGLITFGCAGVVFIQQVRWEAVSMVGPWSIELTGVSLIDGSRRCESSDCAPEVISDYLAVTLVAGQLGIELVAARAHVMDQVPELRLEWS